MVYSGHIRQGMIVLDQPVLLPEGSECAWRLEGAYRPASPSIQDETPGQRLLKYAGKAVGLPPDSARNHDHYHRTAGLLRWTGDPEDLRRIAEDDEFGVMEAR